MAMNKAICPYPEALISVLFLLTACLLCHNIFWPIITKASSTSELPEINLDQTADMKVVFLGIPPEYIDESEFALSTSQSISQFAFPNTMTWSLNVSVFFHEFPENTWDSLSNNAFHSEGITYYNITLLDVLLSQSKDLAIPKRGYLIAFMWVPDNAVNHSWFYVQERPDLFLGRIDYFNGVPFKYWAFPSNFGGIRRALYFDISDIMEKTPTQPFVTNIVTELFNKGLPDIFPDLLGTEDSRMIAADIQRYENYNVKILWLNGTGEQFYPQRIKKSFEALMPWTNWTIMVKTKAMDDVLSDLIGRRTEELSEPLTYSFLLSNGSSVTIEAWRNVKCNFFVNSGEYDPIICYFFDHVEDYFNLTDLEDKSIIPVVFLQLRNDTAFGHATQAGVSWFLRNIIVIGFQGSAVTAIGESGPIFLTQLLRHEIGHWVSLSHHSSNFESGYPKIICSMRSMTNRFCAFCKDARARMSFISYYNATTELLSNNQAKIEVLENELEDALQLFHDWEYIKAVEAIVSTYYKAEAPTLSAEITANPETLNLKSEGKWITAYIELPEDYDASDIDISIVKLNGVIQAELHPTGIGDYDEDGIPDLMVKFSRQDLIAILSVGEATLTITGEVCDTPFEGSDIIRVIGK